MLVDEYHSQSIKGQPCRRRFVCRKAAGEEDHEQEDGMSGIHITLNSKENFRINLT